MTDFELGCAHHSTGLPQQAVVRYRAALATGLTGVRRRRAVIQLASSLRNLGPSRRPG
ncbi:tetratricopeptide repeat protein [Streptomyces apocyni]|uniref:tetratricopeptide repeat protein n=1 Tax=Streptomyces apocyni TaxID=2654677 RepID=UPI0018D064EE|nr:tetratricopeptide repeat protein [Streptomyces apocyni]